MNVSPSRHYVVTAGKAVQHTVRTVFDDSKKNAVESGAKPSGSVIIEGQLRVGPSGAVNVLPPTSGARAGSNTATDADPDEEHRAASVPPFRIMP